ncbi:MAG: hypothetical protein QM774_01335 [Gordonia sp. (in: high G+C Gram-positive bacteria)]|uniref:hypothetical protein n=1 Tax=Gordonia sp. (in: high G+C Gram-positive bacteria) TaxID=84139 RepID=UPI0039E6FB50
MNPNSTETTPEPDAAPTRRSPFLALAGIVTLLVSAWGLTGGVNLPDLNLVPWILIGVGVLVGVVLVISGLRRS